MRRVGADDATATCTHVDPSPTAHRTRHDRPPPGEERASPGRRPHAWTSGSAAPGALAFVLPVTHGDVWLPFPAPRTGFASADPLVLRAAVSAYLGRYRGQTRLHTESDLRVFL